MNPTRRYLENRILTSSKEELLLMLFDGAARFAEQARAPLEARQFDVSSPLLIRAQNVVLELVQTLDRGELGPELFESLNALYGFAHQRLAKANVDHDPVMIDEALRILRHLRDTWAQAIEKERVDKVPATATLAAAAGALNLEG